MPRDIDLLYYNRWSSVTSQEQEKKQEQGQFDYKYNIHKLKKLAIP